MIGFIILITAHTLNPFWILLRMNYNSCLTNLYEEPRTALNDVTNLLADLYCFECTNRLPFITATRPELRSPARTVNSSSVIFCFIHYHEKCVNLVATLRFIQLYSLLRNALLASRCVAMDYSVTIWRGGKTMYLHVGEDRISELSKTNNITKETLENKIILREVQILNCNP
jgi:hypothetical protein